MKYSFINRNKKSGILRQNIKLVIILTIVLAGFSNIFSQQQNKNRAVEIKNDKNKAITTVFLVRHAEKVKSESDDPALHPMGVERSAKLCEMLSEAGINKIYSTNYIRTRETVRPLAEIINVDIQLYKAGDKKFINKMLKRDEGASILISGHSNTIPNLVNQLLKTNKYQNLKDDEYNKLFIVSLTKNSSKCSVIIF